MACHTDVVESSTYVTMQWLVRCVNGGAPIGQVYVSRQCAPGEGEEKGGTVSVFLKNIFRSPGAGDEFGNSTGDVNSLYDARDLFGT